MSEGASEAAIGGATRSPATASWLDRLVTWRGIVFFWVAYGIANGLLRYWLSGTLSLDDSRASELVQTLSLGYELRQPPVYEWLLWISQQAFGAGLASHLVVRYALIAALGLSAYGATLAAIRDRRWAAVASLSLAFTYPVGWTFHEWGTQTIVLSVACFLTLQAAIRYSEKQGWQSILLIGFAVGLGLLAKFSYLLYLGGIVLAIAGLPELRRRFVDPRMLVAALIAVVMMSPYLAWVASVRGDMAGMASDALIVNDAGAAHWQRALEGLGRLAWSLPAFLMPWFAIVFVIAFPAFRPGRGASPPGQAERLALRAMVFAALLAAIGIAAVGATNIGERYMHPILMTAPVYVFARVARLAPGADRMRLFAAISVVFAVAVIVVRVFSFTENPVTEAVTRPFALPFAALAAEFRKQGIVDGTVVGATVREAGNLRAFLPDLRVTAGDSYRVEPVPLRPSDQGSCVIVWRDRDLRDARAIAPIARKDAIRIVAREPAFLGGTRQETWWFARLDPASPACLKARHG